MEAIGIDVSQAFISRHEFLASCVPIFTCMRSCRDSVGNEKS
jgi:hypothetical protein